MPTVTPLVAVAYVWKMMYDPQVGAINTFLGLDINWLFDTTFALPAIITMTIWKDFGYAVILFLAGLFFAAGGTSWKRPRWTGPARGSASGSSPSRCCDR